jgi:subtilase family serine protease
MECEGIVRRALQPHSAGKKPAGGAIAMVALALTGIAGVSPAAATMSDQGATYRPLCSSPTPGLAQCQGAFRTDTAGAVLASSTPAGHSPADLQHAYRLPSSTKGAGQTVAVVDAYDDPNAEADLGTYRSTFGLPPCTSASGCFRKVNEYGGTTYPPADAGWAGEISLDIDMVSAVCPNCHILLVEANTPSMQNLATGVDTAATLHATEISNSYARQEFTGETALDVHYDHPGIMITVASGNNAYAGGTTYPAASPYVTAVGGTKLMRASNSRGWSETAWQKTSSGCSLYEPKPAWQHDADCSKRTEVDTAAVAVYLAVYDTYSQPGWVIAYGTSAPTPIIAGIYALAGNAASLSFGSSTYKTGASLFDITSGSTGTCGTYLCQATTGYDGPTGNGSPNGIGAY